MECVQSWIPSRLFDLIGGTIRFTVYIHIFANKASESHEFTSGRDKIGAVK